MMIVIGTQIAAIMPRVMSSAASKRLSSLWSFLKSLQPRTEISNPLARYRSHVITLTSGGFVDAFSKVMNFVPQVGSVSVDGLKLSVSLGMGWADSGQAPAQFF